MNFLAKYFDFAGHGTNLKTEIIGGLIAFLAMVYILPVNTFMLANAGMNPAAVFAATALASGCICILMGVWGKMPIALAPGMGLNAFFTYTVVLGMGFTWQEALACVFVAGFLFFIITVSGGRKLLIEAIPRDIKFAITVSIGFFIAFIGLQNAGIIVADPATMVTLGDLTNPTVLLALFGIVLTLVLHIRGQKLAILYSIITTTIIGLTLNALGVAGMPAYSPETLGSISAVSETAGAMVAEIPNVLTSKAGIVAIITILFVAFFDTTGTILSIGHNAKLLDEKGDVIGSKKALIVDSIGIMFGAFLGTSAVSSYIESNAGIASGARTGLMAIVVGICFLLSLFLYPLFSIFQGIPVEALGGLVVSPITCAALVLVGAMMIEQIAKINMQDPIIAITTFCCILLTILSFSIATGIIMAFLLYVILMTCSGRASEVSKTMFVITPLLLIYFII